MIDPKTLSKEQLYGNLDSTTMEWTDGVFTSILRKVLDNKKGEDAKSHWIVFDGDVDPVWAENLNSVLDDNKLLTLPNGERLKIPTNLKMLFEVESLRFATLATVSRCGMVWFAEDLLEDADLFYHFTEKLKAGNETRAKLMDFVAVFMQGQSHGQKSFISEAFELCLEFKHVESISKIRLFESFFSQLEILLENLEEEIQLQQKEEGVKYERVMRSQSLLFINWAFAGDLTLEERGEYYQQLSQLPSYQSLGVPTIDSSQGQTLIDFLVGSEGEFVPWKTKVPRVEISQQQINSSSLII